MALIKHIPSTTPVVDDLIIHNFDAEANDSSASGIHVANFSITNKWRKLSVSSYSGSSNSASAYIRGDSTTIWNASGTSGSSGIDIDISNYTSISFHCQSSGAYQTCTIGNITLSN